MADADKKPQRNAAEKERSRQQSRAVTGKEAARTVGGGGRNASRPQKAQRGPTAAPARGQNGRGRPQTARPGARTAGRSPAGARARRPANRGGGSRASAFIWGAVALVVVIVVVVVLVSSLSSGPKSTTVTPEPVPANIVSEVTHINPSVYKAVGIGASASVTAPKVESGQPPLTFTGKPGFFYMGGEFCPFCAAERWSMIAALSRFGSFSGLETMASSSTDVHPSTPTFTFDKATYKSQYLTAKLLEYYGQDKPTGSHPIINEPTKEESKLVTKYDDPTSATSSGSIPFVDIGNKLVVSGSSYTPQLLQGLSRATIAADLSHPTNPVTQAIVGTANYMTAGICASDGAKPASACSTSGVQAAAKALNLSS